MMKHKESNLIIKVIAHLMMPLIMLFAIYVQMHGEISSGGGFQAGVILATAIILYSLAFEDKAFLSLISINTLKNSAAFGALVYLLIGVFCIINGGDFLQYSVLLNNNIFANEIGVFAIELGVGLAVFSVILVLYFTFHSLLNFAINE